MTGTIKKLCSDRGFGFIKNQNGRDIFFHAKNLANCEFTDIQEGLPVEFDEEPGKEGKTKAVNVRVVA